MPYGEAGEIIAATPCVMKGYLNRPEETAPPEPEHQAVDLRALQEQADPETDFIEIDNDDNDGDGDVGDERVICK